MTTKFLIGAGIVWLVVVLSALYIPTDFVIGIRLSQAAGAMMLRLFRGALVILLAVFWIGWTVPLALAAYRLARGY
jgi:glyoxylate carboligase